MPDEVNSPIMWGLGAPTSHTVKNMHITIVSPPYHVSHPQIPRTADRVVL